LGCTQTPRTSTQAETTTGNDNGSMTTVNWGATLVGPEETIHSMPLRHRVSLGCFMPVVRISALN
jgi:hypothetical protein